MSEINYVSRKASGYRRCSVSELSAGQMVCSAQESAASFALFLQEEYTLTNCFLEHQDGEDASLMGNQLGSLFSYKLSMSQQQLSKTLTETWAILIDKLNQKEGDNSVHSAVSQIRVWGGYRQSRTCSQISKLCVMKEMVEGTGVVSLRR